MKRRSFLAAGLALIGRIFPTAAAPPKVVTQPPLVICELCRQVGHLMESGSLRAKHWDGLDLFERETTTVWCESWPVDWSTYERC